MIPGTFKPHSCFDCEHLEKSINAEPCMDCIYGCYWSKKEEDNDES